MKFFRKNKNEKKTELEKIEARREEVLAAGRKLKYPLQYTKHRVVVNTILISFAVLAFFAAFFWLSLYKLQMTNEMMFRITRIIPVSVSEVDGERVLFSDYLMFYRSSILSVERQTDKNDENFDELREQYKVAALNKAEEYTYALKLGRELSINVSNEEIEQEFDRHRSVGGIDRSKEGFLKIVADNFGLDESEYKRMLYLTLMKARVQEAVDSSANKIAERVQKELANNGGDMAAVASGLGDAIRFEETGELIDVKKVDGGRANEAIKLEEGKVSEKFVSINGDGYYFVKLLDKTESSVNFNSIFIPFAEFNKRFEAIEVGGGIKRFITLQEM